MRVSVDVDIVKQNKFIKILSLLPGKIIGDAIEAGVKRGAEKVQERARANVGRKFTKHPTGKLRESIRVEMEGAGRNAKAKVGSDLIYSRIHEYGGIIRPKNAKMLAWRGEDGKMIFAKQVNMPARPYLEPALKMNPFDVLKFIGGAVYDRIRNGIKRIFR